MPFGRVPKVDTLRKGIQQRQMEGQRVLNKQRRRHEHEGMWAALEVIVCTNSFNPGFGTSVGSSALGQGRYGTVGLQLWFRWFGLFHFSPFCRLWIIHDCLIVSSVWCVAFRKGRWRPLMQCEYAAGYRSIVASDMQLSLMPTSLSTATGSRKSNSSMVTAITQRRVLYCTANQQCVNSAISFHKCYILPTFMMKVSSPCRHKRRFKNRARQV